MGGGIGGTAAARRLRRLLPKSDEVVVVNADFKRHFAPSLLSLMTGARRPEQITTDLRRLRRRGIQVRAGKVEEIDLEQRVVETTDGKLPFDALVVALGADLAPNALPGFADGVHNVYSVDGAMQAGKALSGFRGGRIGVLVSRLPYKCPAAPYEAAFLAEGVLRKSGVRGRCSVDIYTPEPFPMPTAGPALGEAVEAMLADHRIGFHQGRTVESVDAAASALALSDGERVGFDLLLGIPPHAAPEVVKRSGLAAETGFVPVNPATLETSVEDVFAIGDVAMIPIAGGKFLPKAGVFAHAQANVVARRLAARFAGRAPSAVFDGEGSCFLSVGDGLAAYASGNFYAQEGPDIRLHRPARRWYMARVALEQYWLRWAA